MDFLKPSKTRIKSRGLLVKKTIVKYKIDLSDLSD
jgi:hypothetical protein